MASSGPNSPGTVANDSSSVGGVAWSNTSFALTSNDQYATVLISPFGSSYFLKCTNFGFSIPSGATINGVIVGVECWSEQLLATDYNVNLVKGGTPSGDNKAYNPDITTESTITYGGISDLWGLTLTPTDINSSTFGAAWAGINSSPKFSSRIYIDTITITVYYTESTGSPRSQAITIG